MRRYLSTHGHQQLWRRSTNRALCEPRVGQCLAFPIIDKCPTFLPLLTKIQTTAANLSRAGALWFIAQQVQPMIGSARLVSAHGTGFFPVRQLHNMENMVLEPHVLRKMFASHTKNLHPREGHTTSGSVIKPRADTFTAAGSTPVSPRPPRRRLGHHPHYRPAIRSQRPRPRGYPTSGCTGG